MNYYKLFIYSIFNSFYKDGKERDSLYWLRPLSVITLISTILTFSIISALLYYGFNIKYKKTLNINWILGISYLAIFYFRYVEKDGFIHLYNEINVRYANTRLLKQWFFISWSIASIVCIAFFILALAINNMNIADLKWRGKAGFIYGK